MCIRDSSILSLRYPLSCEITVSLSSPLKSKTPNLSNNSSTVVIRAILAKQKAGEAVLGIFVAKLRLLPQVVIFLFCPSVRFGRLVTKTVIFRLFISEERSYLIKRQITVLKIAELPMVDAIAVMIHRFVFISNSSYLSIRVCSRTLRFEINSSLAFPSCCKSSLFS